MSDFLLELLSEEIPARMQDKARDDLSRLFAEAIGKAGLVASAIETYATPRRLALIARGLPLTTAASSEEIKGPRASAPPQALEGFLRKTGLAADQLSERDGVLFATIVRPGRRTADVLGEAIPAIVRVFPWPKSMRWGAASADSASLRWVRPLHGIVALLDDEVVPCAIDGIVAGAATLGHRFHHPGPITIGNAGDYAAKLEACHVIVDQDRRRAIIRERGAALAAAAGLAVVPDEGLVAENAGLTEWPVPLLGGFDPAFLDVPREVIQLTMRTNQKYFALTDAGGELAPNFLCTANIEASDGGAGIVDGNRKVLAARLADARFFWEQDRKVPLAEQAEKLDRIVFHEKLGTVADKVARVAKLSRWLVEEGIVRPAPLPPAGGAGGGDGPSASATPVAGSAPPPTPPAGGRGDLGHLADMAEQAAMLCKADLVSGMVGEFPELQGVMGGYYARAEGYPDDVADAIRDHYKPVGQGDEVPTAPVTVAVSLADKLETLLSFFGAEMVPTGSRDPFALRRATLGILRMIQANGLAFRIDHVARYWSGRADAGLGIVLTDFFHDRLGVQLRDAGIRYDVVAASTTWNTGLDHRLDRVATKARALQALIGCQDGINLLSGYKRAANILKREGWSADRHPGPVPGSTSPDGPAPAAGWTPAQGRGDDEMAPAEAALVAALDAAEPRAAAAIAAEDFEGAMAALATLRAPIDAFFEAVIVNDPDPAIRALRLALLARVRDAVHRVADFSRIEG